MLWGTIPAHCLIEYLENVNQMPALMPADHNYTYT